MINAIFIFFENIYLNFVYNKLLYMYMPSSPKSNELQNINLNSMNWKW